MTDQDQASGFNVGGSIVDFFFAHPFVTSHMSEKAPLMRYLLTECHSK